jgi:hypothetical protein
MISRLTPQDIEVTSNTNSCGTDASNATGTVTVTPHSARQSVHETPEFSYADLDIGSLENILDSPDLLDWVCK